MLTDQEFERRAGDAIEALYKTLAEAAEQWEFDVEVNSGALTVEFESPRERFVVSPNAPVSQIWVSALVHSYKLDWDAAHGAFILASSGQTLTELMQASIAQRLPGFELQ